MGRRTGEGTGWGAMTVEDLYLGSFVCEYAGLRVPLESHDLGPTKMQQLFFFLFFGKSGELRSSFSRGNLAGCGSGTAGSWTGFAPWLCCFRGLEEGQRTIACE